MPLSVVTWNVNSIRVREPAVLAWLEARRPDVLCLQETKLTDEKFPRSGFEALGYQVVTHGQRAYNGVAILSRHEISQVDRGFPDDEPEAQCRALALSTAGLRILNVYVPNGQTVGSEKFAYKLAWLRRLRAHLERTAPGAPLVVCGDFNVAPEPRDVHDPAAWEGEVLFHPDARAALAQVVAFGLRDAFRLHHEDGGHHTWWDYRLNAFKRKMGLRIDHILLSQSVAARSLGCEIDVEPRRQPQPSDHAPVLATLSDP